MLSKEEHVLKRVGVDSGPPIILDFNLEERSPILVLGLNAVRSWNGKVRDFIFEEVPERFYRQFQIQPQDLLRKRLSEIPPDLFDAGAFHSNALEAMRLRKVIEFILKDPRAGGCYRGILCRGGGDRLQVLIDEITDRKRNEEEEARSRLLDYFFNSSPSSIMVRDLSGKIILFNEAMGHCLPVLKEKANQLNFFDIVKKEKAEAILANEQRVIEDGVPLRFEEKLESDEGVKIYTTLKFPVRHGDGRIYGVGSVVTDITEVRMTEEKLRESQDRYQSFFENSIDAVLLLLKDGTIEDANAEACSVFGMSREELIAVGCVGIVDSSDSRLREAFMHMTETGKYKGEIRFRRKDGSVFPGEISTAYYTDKSGRMKITVFIRDISERQRILADLRFREEITGEFLKNQAVFAWLKDENGRYLFISQNGIRQLGCDANDWLNKTNFDFWPTAIAETLWRNDAMVLTTGKPMDFVEETLDKNGKPMWFLSSKFLYKSPLGKKYIGGLAVDITERILAEKALQESDRHKDQFLAMLSHELRNPLASIRNSMYILDSVPPDGPQAKKAKEIIGRQFNQLCRIVDDLLDVTRIDRNKLQINRESLELTGLIHKTVEDYQLTFDQKEISLNYKSMMETAHVMGDPLRLAQMLGNLLQNAAKFTERNGRVSVSVEPDEDRRNVLITVADTGIGISPDLIPHMFEPFVQAEMNLDRSLGGLGLGLTLVKGIVELHGGQVEVVSPGKGLGTVFTVRLPLENPLDLSLPHSGGNFEGFGFKTLIIEDNVDVAESLQALLSLLGIEASIAFSGTEGLAAVRNSRPNVVICDIGLPGMDGYAVARAIRSDKTLNDLFLLALTGYAMPEDIEKARNAGFDNHLAKPPEFATLERILTEILMRK